MAMDIKYLDLVRNLEHCKTWSWGSIALSVLYHYLGDASMSNTKPIGGYMTLLQTWIFEHFPTICTRKERVGYTEDNYRAKRWLHKRGTSRLLPFRRAIDALQFNDVCWTPYTEHRPCLHLQDLSSFLGYIRFCSITVLHLLERVLRQFGYIQDIPRAPIPVPTTTILNHCWIQYHVHSVRNTTSPAWADLPGQCTKRYMEWFFVISHPYLIPPDSEYPVQDSETESVPETEYACCNASCLEAKEMLNEVVGILQTMAYTQSCVGCT